MAVETREAQSRQSRVDGPRAFPCLSRRNLETRRCCNRPSHDDNRFAERRKPSLDIHPRMGRATAPLRDWPQDGVRMAAYSKHYTRCPRRGSPISDTSALRAGREFPDSAFRDLWDTYYSDFEGFAARAPLGSFQYIGIAVRPSQRDCAQ